MGWGGRNMIWERIRHNRGNYIDRTPIFGGWLVMTTDDVMAFAGELDDRTFITGYQYRTSISFVPDPQHLWNLNEDPLAHRQEACP